MSDTKAWYIIKSTSGTCQIVTTIELDEATFQEKWGPFDSQGDAIARRVGLIRAGKCQPA
ncbi:MAG: hypothetical protein F6K42_30015 [Leptolyngbya sp. SIO1D8]|nr:hypothetical protein [Leptolyngbya sp. SIO1D8]